MNSLEVNNLKEHGAINIIFKEILFKRKRQFFLKPFRKKRNRANKLVKGNLFVFFQVSKGRISSDFNRHNFLP